MTWRPAKCLDVLIRQVNTAYPTRPKQSDGLLGDAAHAARPSSHNPDRFGVVRGWDCTTAPFCQQLAEDLRLLGKAGDPRALYVIYRNRFTSAKHGWEWVDYQTVNPGGDPHTNHIHLSVSDDPAIYDRTDPWPVLGHVTAHTATAPTVVLKETDMVIVYADHRPVALLAAGRLKALKTNAEKDALHAAGIPVQKVTPDQFDLINTVAKRRS